MKKKLSLILKFIPLAFSDFSLLLKNLMKFTEEQIAKRKVHRMGFEKGLPVIDLLDLLPDFNETVNSYTFLDDTSPDIDIALLKGLAKRFSPSCNYLEIGSWRGESIVNISETTENSTSLSLSTDEMKQLGFTEKQIQLNAFFSKHNSKIKHIGHNSQTFDFNSFNQKFDLIFVDGDHHYDAVVNDTKNVFTLLKDNRSVVVWHDYGSSFESVRWDVLAGILEGTPASERKNLYRVSNTFCAIYIQDKLPSRFSEFPETPNKIFSVNIKAEKLC